LIGYHKIAGDAIYAIAIEGRHILVGTYGGKVSLFRLPFEHR
jgi:hypothetical protein